MKKVIFPLLFIALGLLIYFLVSEGPDYQEQILVSVQPVEKTPSLNRPSSNNEEKNYPKTVSPQEKQKRSLPLLKKAGRTIIGEDFQETEHFPEKTQMENKVNPNWQTFLKEELREEDNSDNQIDIQHLESFIIAQQNIGLYAEKVNITIVDSQGTTSSFHALIDSESGEILHAWEGGNRPLHEVLASDMESSDPFAKGEEIHTERFSEDL